MKKNEIKRRIKKTLYLSGTFTAYWSGLAYFHGLLNGESGLKVLMYHKINDVPDNPISVPKSLFAKQVQYLTNHFTILSPDEVFERVAQGTRFTEKEVLVTFDDGYLDNLTNAAAILKRHDIKALLFIATDFPSGGVYLHDQNAGCDNPLLTWQQIKDVQNTFEIGSHGCSHRVMTKIPFQDAVTEIRHSKQILERKTGNEIRAFSWPKGSVGDFDEKLMDSVRNAGYKLCFTTVARRNKAVLDPYRINRYNVEDYGMAYFRHQLSGAADIVGLKDSPFGYRAKQTVNKFIGSPEK